MDLGSAFTKDPLGKSETGPNIGPLNPFLIIVPICDQKDHLEEWRSVHFPTFTADGASSDLKAPPHTNILCDAPGGTEISVLF